MAEATKTLSLENDAIYEPGDEIWMGHSVIPRDVACCETTVNLPLFPISAIADGDIRKSAFVVNDLSKHSDLCTRPFVTGFPNGRFYAGVPITTPSGVNIGAYCILDDEVRDGVSDADLMFLRDMSQTITTHLETVCVLSQQQQINRMVTGLGDYVRGAADAGSKAPPATNIPMNKGYPGVSQSRTVEFRLPDALVDPIGTPSTTSLHSVNEYFSAKYEPIPSAGHTSVPEASNISVPHSSDYGKTPSVNNQQQKPLTCQMRAHIENVPQRIHSLGKAPTANSPPGQSQDADPPERTYQRAAENLCQSLDIDGVVFLDACAREFGGLSEARNAEHNEGSAANSDDSAGSLPPYYSASERPSERARVCKVLGCAQTLHSSVTQTDYVKGRPVEKLTESFLRRLMRRNPHGKIWTFDEDFKTHSEDGFSSDEPDVDAKVSTEQREDAREGRRSDAQILQAAFPGSRCIALHGMWDYTRKRWAIAGLYWTYNPLRLIAKDTEMRFVAAFCDVIVAETKRFEVLATDKAKSDFISSISHELCYPLHGILGSCELLSDHGLDNTAKTLLAQIDSCGRTLLEVIEHLLDFANLRSQRLKSGAVQSSKIGRKFLQSTEDQSIDDLKALDMCVALDVLTEDVIISSVYSFHYGQKGYQTTHTPVILDIDRSDGKSWHCSLATGGWKRVCINLVTNALKYTPSGVIRVSLKRESRRGSRRRFDAVLTVSDSGVGMSKSFQTGRLFQDFAQENTLSDGLGLGMHMVSGILYAMGGKVEVVSDQEGGGTCVTVRVPLEHSQPGQPSSDASNGPSVTALKIFESLKVGVVTGIHDSISLKTSPTTAVSAMAIASVENNLKSLGIQFEQCKGQHVNTYDLMVVMEAGLAEHLETLQKSNATDNGSAKSEDNVAPMLVICNNGSSAQKLRDMLAMDYSHMIITFITLPCGIKQIAHAISSSVHLWEKRTIPVPEMPQARGKSQLESSAEGIALHETGILNQLQVRPPAPPTTPTTIVVLEQPRAEPAGSPLEDAGAFSTPLSLAGTQSPHSLSRLIPISVTNSDEQSACILVPKPPSIEVSTKFAVLPTTKAPMLLLVDDNSINLTLLATFAKKYKYSYLTAQDGQLAIDAFENAHKKLGSQNSSDELGTSTEETRMPNVILMDINMPVMDGYEAVQRIRAYEKKHELTAAKIIAVTALQSEAAQAEAFGSGFDLFLSKPLRLTSLATLIESF
jgi:signal transduction histidine kinase/CheY-like chemotaxis protein